MSTINTKLSEKELELLKLEKIEHDKYENSDKKELPRLAQKLSYLEDIKPYRLIQISAGVGAGKNYWAGLLIKAGFRVLLITSRQATANAQAENLSVGRWIKLEEIIEADDSWDIDPDNKYRNVICTNASIEKYVKYQVKKGNRETYLWKYFDFIILDEAHSMAMDATYSDAPFYVESFLKMSYRKNPDLKIIFMTGTPEPVDWLMPDENKHDDYVSLNFLQACRHVIPKNVTICPKEDSIYQLFRLYMLGEKVIYFANTISRLSHITDSLIMLGVPEEEIFVSYSVDNINKDDEEQEGRAKDIPASILQKMQSLQRELESDEILPEGIRIFLTTSKNKEGINIKDTDLRFMFADSHVKTDLIQMSGRVRNGLDTLYVVDSVFQHHTDAIVLDGDISRASIGGIKNNYPELLTKHNEKAIRLAIESHFNAIRYNIFTNTYSLYRGRIQGAAIQNNDPYAFNSYVHSWNTSTFVIEDDSSSTTFSGRDMLQTWFPESNVNLITEALDLKALFTGLVDAHIIEKGYNDGILKKEKQNQILEELNVIIAPCQRMIGKVTQYKNLGDLLRNWSSYSRQRVGKAAIGNAVIVPKSHQGTNP